jgi:L-ascorbate metabolism protein UlaG (beta-lactamase superfamily)
MNSTSITYFGQSCFLLEYNNSKLLIDPRKKSHSQIEGDILYATHHHMDHTAGIDLFLEINTSSGVLISNIQVTKKYSQSGKQVITIKAGEKLKRGVWDLEFISGKHGFFRGVDNIGIVVKTPSFTFGHLGDSINFDGFANLEGLDMLAVPIGSMFAASPKGALKELEKFTKPLPIIVPMHWLWRNPKGFCKKLTKEFPNAKCIVPKNGEKISY